MSGSAHGTRRCRGHAPEEANKLGATVTMAESSAGGVNPYPRFAAMVAVSTLVMFGLMYLNTFAADHIFFSQTRAWMAVVMGSVMATGMLLFMWDMYPSRRANLAILAGSAAIFALSLWLVRGQATVDDVSYMRAMIPHHSIAIMTSERAHIRDPRVRKLADGIIAAQVREIGEMKALISDLEQHPTKRGSADLQPGAPPPG